MTMYKIAFFLKIWIKIESFVLFKLNNIWYDNDKLQVQIQIHS